MRALSTSRAAFTLIEILAVVAIVGILAALAFPFLGKLAARSKSVQCLSNLRQLGAAVQSYAAENDTYPGGSETFNNAANPLWEILRPYTGGGNRLAAIGIWECPLRAIKNHPSGTHIITPAYTANQFIFVDARDAAIGGPSVPQQKVRPWSVSRPAGIIALIDAGQRSPSGWSNPILIGGFFSSTPSEASARQPIVGEPVTAPDSDIVPASGVRYRHDGRAQAVFLDGHVEPFEKGTILQKNFAISY